MSMPNPFPLLEAYLLYHRMTGEYNVDDHGYVNLRVRKGDKCLNTYCHVDAFSDTDGVDRHLVGKIKYEFNFKNDSSMRDLVEFESFLMHQYGIYCRLANVQQDYTHDFDAMRKIKYTFEAQTSSGSSTFVLYTIPISDALFTAELVNLALKSFASVINYEKPLKSIADHDLFSARKLLYSEEYLKMMNYTDYTKCNKKPKIVGAYDIKKVQITGNMTTVIWADGSHTSVTMQEGEEYCDYEKAVAMCVAKRAVGTNKSGSNFNKIINDHIEKALEANEKREEREFKKRLAQTKNLGSPTEWLHEYGDYMSRTISNIMKKAEAEHQMTLAEFSMSLDNEADRRIFSGNLEGNMNTGYKYNKTVYDSAADYSRKTGYPINVVMDWCKRGYFMPEKGKPIMKPEGFTASKVKGRWVIVEDNK